MRTALTVVVVALVGWLLFAGLLLALGRTSAAREVAGLVPNLFRLFRGLLRDPRVPRRHKLLLGFAIAWIASPIDLIPEFVPVIGPLDDAIVAALVLRRVLRAAGPDVIAQHWRGDPAPLRRLRLISGRED